MRRKPLNGRYRVGLLGGSFNPAHEGHLHISEIARKKLKLDAIWWLVSPGNPLKDPKEYTLPAIRIEQAEDITKLHPSYVVADIESELGTHYTVDTLRELHKRFPSIEFIWLMGGDNLSSFHKWKSWRELMVRTRILVIDRAPFTYSTLHSKAAIFGKGKRRHATSLPLEPSGAWAYVHAERHPAASRIIRNNKGA